MNGGWIDALSSSHMRTTFKGERSHMRTMNPLNLKSEWANDESEERPIATKISICEALGDSACFFAKESKRAPVTRHMICAGDSKRQIKGTRATTPAA